MSTISFPILIVGVAQRTSLEQMYLRAFQANGCREVDLLDVEANRPDWSRNRLVNRFLPRFGHNLASQRLLTHLRGCKNRYRWIIIFKGMQFSRQMLEECKRLAPTALWININPDDPYNLISRAASNSNIIDSLSFFDVYCIWSHLIADRLRNDGCKKVIYLPFGYDTSYHVPHKPQHQTSTALISFIGSWDKEREANLAQLAGYDFCIHGNGWKRASRAFPLSSSLSFRDVFGSEMAAVIASSDICLNLLRPQNRGSHNMRTFELPAMGGLMLTNRTAEQQEFFPENDSSYMYDDVAELKAKIEYILANKREADQVRARGMERVRGNSYSIRAQFLLKELD
jgi:spore maturation protein CgeB